MRVMNRPMKRLPQVYGFVLLSMSQASPAYRRFCSRGVPALNPPIFECMGHIGQVKNKGTLESRFASFGKAHVQLCETASSIKPRGPLPIKHLLFPVRHMPLKWTNSWMILPFDLAHPMCKVFVGVEHRPGSNMFQPIFLLFDGCKTTYSFKPTPFETKWVSLKECI